MSICLAITDADWALTKDVFSVIGTFVSAVGVGLASWVGFSGLATWRRQLKGASDHELSRRALIELYRYRDAMEQARLAGMLGWEFQLSADEAAGLSFAEKHHLELRKGYQRRLEALRSAREPIHITLLDSEAVWDRTLTDLFAPLFKLHHEFAKVVELNLIASDPREDEDDRRPYREILKSRRDIMYDTPDEKGDDFRQEFEKACAAVESYLKDKRL